MLAVNEIPFPLLNVYCTVRRHHHKNIDKNCRTSRLSDDHHKVEVDGPGLVRMVHSSEHISTQSPPHSSALGDGGATAGGITRVRNAIRTCRSIPLFPSSLLSCSSLVHLLFSFPSKGLDLKIIDRRSQIALAWPRFREQGSINDSELERAPKEPVSGSSTQLGTTHVNNSYAMCTVRTTTS